MIVDINNTSRMLNNVFDILEKEFENGFVVMNKYEDMPNSIPSDIDLDIHQNDFENLDKVISNLSRKTGLIITQKIWHHYRKCAYILTPLNVNKPFRLQLDFFSDFSFKNTPLLLPFEEIQSRTRKHGRFTIPDYDIEYVFLLMRRICKNDFNESHVKIINKVLLSGDKEQIKKYSEQYFGKKYSEIIYNAILCNDHKILELNRNKFWKKLKTYSKIKTFGFYKIKYILSEVWRKIYRINYPIGLSVALLSPDGGGKSTVFSKLEYLCWGSFHGIEKKYFRPRLFKNIGSYNILNPTTESESNVDPHNVKLDNPLKSLLRFIFYNFDFLLGYLFIVKPATIKKKLVVFDRYYFDYFVDLHRYKLDLPMFIPKIFQFMIPQPSITFILNGSAEEFYNRKQELSIDELQRQIKSYVKLSSNIENAVIIDGNQKVNDVAEKITSIILAHKATQTAVSMRNILDENYIPQ